MTERDELARRLAEAERANEALQDANRRLARSVGLGPIAATIALDRWETRIAALEAEAEAQRRRADEAEAREREALEELARMSRLVSPLTLLLRRAAETLRERRRGTG